MSWHWLVLLVVSISVRSTFLSRGEFLVLRSFRKRKVGLKGGVFWLRGFWLGIRFGGGMVKERGWFMGFRLIRLIIMLKGFGGIKVTD